MNPTIPIRRIRQMISTTSGDLYLAVFINSNGILRYRGGVWTELTAGTSWGYSQYMPVAIDPFDNNPSTSPGKGVYHYNGSGWDLISGSATDTVTALAINPSNGHIYISEGTYTVKTYDGSSWTSLPAAPAKIQFIDVTSSGVLYGVSDFHCYKYEGAWTMVGDLDTHPLSIGNLAVNDGSGNVFVSTRSAIIRYSDGSGWTTIRAQGTVGTYGKYVGPSLAVFGDHGVAATVISDNIISSDNDGDSWNNIDAGLKAISPLALAIDPDNLHIIAATNRVYVGYDDGAHWEQAADLPITPMFTSNIYALSAIKSGGTTYWFAGTDVGVFRSSDHGASWEDFNDANLDQYGVWELVTPSSGYFAGKILAATDNGIYATAPDVKNWTGVTESTDLEGVVITGLTTSQSGDTLYAATEDAVWTSVAPGTVWTIMAPIDPYLRNDNNKNPILVTRSGVLLVGTAFGAFRSIDEGSTWERVTVDDGVFAFLETADGNVYAATSRGVYSSTSDGLHWAPQNDGFPAANPAVYSIISSPTSYLFAGLVNYSVWKSAVPVGEAPMISGKVFLDALSTCDPSQEGLNHWKIKTDASHAIVVFSDENGYYEINDPAITAGTYTLELHFKPNYDAACPVPSVWTQTVTYDGVHPLTNVNFGVKRTPGIQDLKIELAGSVARPGREKMYSIHYENTGSVPAPGAMVTFHPDARTLYEFEKSVPLDNGHSGDPVWNLGTLNPGDAGYILLTVLIAIPPVVNLGDVLSVSARIDPVAGDDDASDNTVHENETVRASFDPNEKSVSPAGAGELHAVGITDTLRYHIDFQNVGTDTAFDIIVRDTLDPVLDLTTFEVGASSHPFTYDVGSGGNIDFYFMNIKLPDSTTNETGSHGFIEYTIRPRSGVSSGTEIMNRANVFFDFNLPVMTNAVTNRVAMLTTLQLSSRWNLVSHPFSDADLAVHAIFPHSQTQAYYYQSASGYVPTDIMAHGAGYWIRSDSARSPSFFAVGITNLTIPVEKGWNLIGSIGSTIPVTSIIGSPDTIVKSLYYGYAGAYVSSASIIPGKGYWVKAARAGTLTLNAVGPAAKPACESGLPALAQEWGSLVVTDATGRQGKLYLANTQPGGISRALFALPPLPPTGGFDVRFGSNSLMEYFGSGEEHPVFLQDPVYPVTVQFSMGPGGERALELIPMENGSRLGVQTLGNGRSITLNDENIRSFVIRFDEGAAVLPGKYALGRNYPNPFNPMTKLQYALPVRSHVTLTVYDVLGRVVATLVDGIEDAGFRQTVWNGSGAASGLYFYKLDAASVNDPALTFTDIKKMLLVK